MRIDPNYTEDTVSIAVAVHLTALTFPTLDFSIEPFSRSQERWLGADVRLTSRVKGILPFYMQFKRPHAYTDASRSKIIHNRKALKPPLGTAPRTLYFSLREKRPAHKQYQHNVLYKLNNRLMQLGIGEAAYVCPLFLDRAAYLHHAHLAGLALRGYPNLWRRYAPVRVHAPSVHRTINFARVPMLAEHVVIPPHSIVTSAKHSYSFLENGQDVCFHSPLSLPEGSISLGAWVGRLTAKFFDTGTLVRPESAPARLRQLLQPEAGNVGFGFDMERFDNQVGFVPWMAWGDYLQREFEIEQFALVAYEP